MGLSDKKIKFYVATNWQRDLIPNIKHPDIEEIYGKLNTDFVGGGKASSILPFVSKRVARLHIQQAHQHGLKFNYLLNGVCLDNKEFTSYGQKKLHLLLDWIAGIGADSVTVSIPYLLQLIKKQYPYLKVYASIYAGVDSIEKAKYWENLGADLITLSSRTVRDFPLLKEIRKNTTCKLQLIGNMACLYDCPLLFYHKHLLSHASQSNHISGGFLIDYCYLNCFYKKISSPLELIRASWIRPEDVFYYEEIGIDRIKILDRFRSTESMISIINVYVSRNYSGNLIDLLFNCSGNAMWQKSKFYRRLKYFFHPFHVNIWKMRKVAGLFSSIPIFINNKALDGFLGYFLKESCYLKSCQECGYCEQIAKKVVEVDSERQAKILSRCKDVLEELITSKMFRYV